MMGVEFERWEYGESEEGCRSRRNGRGGGALIRKGGQGGKGMDAHRYTMV